MKENQRQILGCKKFMSFEGPATPSVPRDGKPSLNPIKTSSYDHECGRWFRRGSGVRVGICGDSWDKTDRKQKEK